MSVDEPAEEVSPPQADNSCFDRLGREPTPLVADGHPSAARFWVEFDNDAVASLGVRSVPVQIEAPRWMP